MNREALLISNAQKEHRLLRTRNVKTGRTQLVAFISIKRVLCSVFLADPDEDNESK